MHNAERLLYVALEPIVVLELRPNCEHCNRDLPPDSVDARICSFACTFCVTCVEQVLSNVCPNCGGGLERRPVRPREKLTARPAGSTRVYKPADRNNHHTLVARLGGVAPEKR